MKQIFSVANEGIPISIIDSENYHNWLAQQSEYAQNWLKVNAYDGKGLATLPDENGQLAQCIFGIKNQSDFFIAGDLALQLPSHQYCIDSIDASLLAGHASDMQFRKEFAISWGLSCYRYEKYKKQTKALPILALNSQEVLDEVASFVSSTFLVRDLINTPASDLMPENFSDITDELAQEYGATVTHIIGSQLLDQNYPTIHAVGRASVHEPRLVDLRWGDKNAPRVTLVGKGVCFDSGGLDLKPSGAMRLMKKDMGGAAHVLGLAKLLMSQDVPIQLRVLIPAVENAVSSNAFRPGDVLTTRQGITVEIDNTDAEGRLVLCDALTEANSEQPDLIFDFATLTGACRVALGTELPGFFSNNDQLASDLVTASKRAKDPIWQLPLHTPYQDMLKSDIADTLNSAPTGLGGAITAALYLQLFVSDTTPWVHFDVMAWNNRKLPGRPTGGEAFAIRAVFDYIKNRYTIS
jgi:leucyl aminopeptidase